MKFDPLSILPWAPLHNMEIAEQKYAKNLGLNTFHSRWGVGQLLYLNLDWSEVERCVDFERMNWDSTFGMDFATLASILNTNKVACRSWREFKRILEVYQESWKTRFLISLFCEGVGKEGCLGKPLYYSELVGYHRKSFFRRKQVEGLLDIIAKDPGDAFEWMVSRVVDKMSDRNTARKLLRMLRDGRRSLVYPFLLHGSTAWASFNKLEKLGGRDTFIGKDVPEEVREEVYMMLISAASHLFFFGPKPKQFTYKEVLKKIRIKELTHFGADTSICASPHFVFLQAEIGHLTSLLQGKLGELSHSLFTGLAHFASLSAPDRELTFDRVTSSSPPEMPNSASFRAEKKRREREKPRYTINPEWLKRLRTEDFDSEASPKPSKSQRGISRRKKPVKQVRRSTPRHEPDDSRKQLVEKIQKLICANTWESKMKYLKINPDLLTEEAVSLALLLMDSAEYLDDAELFHVAGDHADLLGRCRRLGIQSGVSEHMKNRRTPEESARMMKAIKGGK